MEKWLLQVQEGMIQSLKDVMIRAVTGYTQVPRTQWVIEWPGQVVIAASSIYWTADVSNAIVNGTLKVSICVCEGLSDVNTPSFSSSPPSHRNILI